MGEFLQSHCPKCDDYEDFKIGVGMRYETLGDVLFCMKGKAKLIASEIVFSVLPHEAEFAHQLLTCPKCDTLHSRFYLKVEYGNRKKYETTFRCGKCQTTLIKTTKPIVAHKCKKCGNYSLEEDLAGIWD